MAQILLLDGDTCLWNVLCEVLESEGYTVWRAHNDYEGLPPALTGFMALTRRAMQYVVIV
jgi:CheY-like chemotaxis protein